MAFSKQVARLDQRVLRTFRKTDPVSGVPLTLTLHYQSGSEDVVLEPVTRNPALEEDFLPGSTTTNELIGVLILFVRPDTLPSPVEWPRTGDTVTYPTGSFISYNVTRVGADREGGAVLYLRRKSA